MKCEYYDRPRFSYPCSKCKYKGIDCENSKNKEPLTCWHCLYYLMEDKRVCYCRSGRTIDPCEHFEWS